METCPNTAPSPSVHIWKERIEIPSCQQAEGAIRLISAFLCMCSTTVPALCATATSSSRVFTLNIWHRAKKIKFSWNWDELQISTSSQLQRSSKCIFAFAKAILLWVLCVPYPSISWAGRFSWLHTCTVQWGSFCFEVDSMLSYPPQMRSTSQLDWGERVP